MQTFSYMISSQYMAPFFYGAFVSLLVMIIRLNLQSFPNLAMQETCVKYAARSGVVHWHGPSQYQDVLQVGKAFHFPRAFRSWSWWNSMQQHGRKRNRQNAHVVCQFGA